MRATVKKEPKTESKGGTMKGRMGGSPCTAGNASTVPTRLYFLPEVGTLPHLRKDKVWLALA